MQVFRDIDVFPPGGSDRDGHVPEGGPLWPDFESQVEPRHCRNGRPVDLTPHSWDGPWETVRTPVVWGGLLHPAFGHLVAEMTTRVPRSLLERPDDPFLFIARAGLTKDGLLPHVTPLLEWYGLPQDRWRLVETGLRVAELRVAPQAEQLSGVAPTPDHLEMMDRIAARNALVPEVRPLLYVTRLGMIPRYAGGHAGESYLVERLIAAGVPVLDPAAAPLRAQLASYAGAATIVFAEGSAAHGRQLLGWRDQRIVILNRRPKFRLAEAALRARVPHLDYVEATKHIVAGVRDDGVARVQKGLAILDLDALFATFAELGIDLAHDWDMAAYRTAVKADLAVWARMMAHFRSSTDVARTKERIESALGAAGLAEYSATVILEIMDGT